MRINHKILSIPPYISTSWKNVLSLHMEQKEGETVLIINLINGTFIEIPHLDGKLLEAIFTAHEKALEYETSNGKSFFNLPAKSLGEEPSATMISFPFRLGADGSIENMSALLQHNAEAAENADLPKEVLSKILSLAKMIGLDNTEQFSKAEPHCNCTYCQIMRAVHGEEKELAALPTEESVSDADLAFRDWEIKQTADKLFIVTNPLNQEEHYNVFLGSPVGCTCGSKNCEHIRAVLNS